MRRQLAPALVVFIALTLLTGVAYPLAVTGVAQVAFPGRANGSLVERDGRVVGSRLIGQAFAGARYFHPRPSAAGEGYDAMASSASNLGPTNGELIRAVRERRAAYRRENDLRPGQQVPIDAVTASGSGLDPDISVANARLQAARVAQARGLDLHDVLALIDEHTKGRSLGFLGEPGVNVLELNLALDGASG
jgi:K+-transporting ATPase ATPase C chain